MILSGPCQENPLSNLGPWNPTLRVTWQEPLGLRLEQVRLDPLGVERDYIWRS